MNRNRSTVEGSPRRETAPSVILSNAKDPTVPSKAKEPHQTISPSLA